MSLSEKIRRNERDKRRQHALELENRIRLSRNLEPLTLEDKEKEEEDDLIVEEDDDPVLKIQLEEAARILADHIGIQHGKYAIRPVLQ